MTEHKKLIKSVAIQNPWAIAKVGEPTILARYPTKEQAERNKGNRIDLEVRKIIG